MDQQKLRSLVFEKTGVKIDIDDPVFALVALNEAVLAEAVERHVALLHQATAELGAQVAALQGDASPPTPLQVSPTPARLAPARPESGAARWSGADKRGAGIAAGAALLGALLVLAGQALLFQPPPAPPVVQAKELTPEQAAAVRNGEKLAKIVKKLDRKTRDMIAAEMEKP